MFYIHQKKTVAGKYNERLKEQNRKKKKMLKPSVIAKRGNGHFLCFPISFILSHHVGEKSVWFQRVAPKKVGAQQNRGKTTEQKRGIKCQKVLLGLSAAQLTSTCL